MIVIALVICCALTVAVGAIGLWENRDGGDPRNVALAAAIFLCGAYGFIAVLGGKVIAQ